MEFRAVRERGASVLRRLLRFPTDWALCLIYRQNTEPIFKPHVVVPNKRSLSTALRSCPLVGVRLGRDHCLVKVRPSFAAVDQNDIRRVDDIRCIFHQFIEYYLRPPDIIYRASHVAATLPSSKEPIGMRVVE